MTRTYAAKRLLEHGPLTFREFHAITGWTKKQAQSTIAALINTEVAQGVKESGYAPRRYRLKEAA